MTPEQLLAAHGIKLDGTAPGRHYTTCPKCSATRSRAHQGSKCLGVTIEGDGSVRWGCNHCGWTGPEKGVGGNGHHGQARSAATYNYRDAAGNVLFQKVRNPPGHAQRFWLRRPDGKGGWIAGTKSVNTKTIYRIDEVTKAIAEGRIIVVAEGEKDVDNLWAIDVAATCNAHGASEPGKKPKWIKTHSEQLRGADLVVLNDNDAAGYEHAETICRMSVGVAKRVRRLDLAKHWPEIPKGGDVSDWLAAGHSGEDFAALIASALDYVATEQAEEAQGEDQEPSAADAEITRLAKLSMAEYELQRKAAADKLGMRASILDKLVTLEFMRLNPAADDGKQGRPVTFPEPEPWPEAVSGPALLNGIAGAIRRHIVMPRHAVHAAALWTLHTFLVSKFFISPRLGIRSPTKGCGKTLFLDVLARLVLRPLPTANVTPPAIFRAIEAHQPCLLIDEADTFLYESDELRGVLNSGYRKGGSVLRTVGEDFEPRAFATYSACAIAIIGALPDTLHDRAVTIELQRRRLRQRIEPFRPDRADYLDVLARKAMRWTTDHADRIGERDPDMPDGIINREADNWRPLLAIADEAGGRWINRARDATRRGHSADMDESSLFELLLADIRDVFGKQTQMTSAELVTALVAIEGRPWADGLGKNRDKPLTTNRLAGMLKRFKITSENIRVGEKVPKGYLAERFADAFASYLGVSETLQRYKADEMGTSDLFQTATAEIDVADRKCEKPNNDGHCSVVADRKGGNGDARAAWEDSPASGLGEARRQELLGWCRNWIAQGEPIEDLDDALRMTIREEVADLSQVEVEFEKVKRLLRKEDGTVASVPFMLTQEMKRRLRICGYSDAQIAAMTPQQAHSALGQFAP
jgi:hypothetical protein